MDLTTILVAVIGATATIAAAWLSGRSRKTTGNTPRPVSRDQVSRVLSIIALGISLTFPPVLWLALSEQINRTGKTEVVRSSAIHFFSAEKYVKAWPNRTGGPFTEDFSDFVPEGAQGAILKVIVSSAGESGSFVCADSKGLFNTDVGHFSQISFTNFSDKWVGGLVFCPLTKNRTLKWQMMSNQSQPAASPKVFSYGTLLGWF